MTHPDEAQPAPSPPHVRAAYGHWMQERVRWSDTDLIGHANNVAVSAYFETGRSHFMRSVDAIDAEPRAPLVLAQLTINFLGEMHWLDVIDIGTGCLSIGRSSCRTGQALFVGERCVGTAESVVVMIDEVTRKPVPLPSWLRQWLDQNRIAALG